MARTTPSLQDLSDKKISAVFWQYALPAILGTTVNTLYSIIDGIFIGHWVGNAALSAAGLILPVMNLAASVGMLVGVGSASRLSIYLGLKDNERAEKIIGGSFLLSLLLSGLTLACLLIFVDPILHFVGASSVTFPYAKDFLVIFLPGSIFLTLAFNYNSMMRACGYPLKAMITMFISVIANIILAPVFILWLGLEMRGAAIATVLSMMISFIFVMQHFTSKTSRIRLRIQNIRLQWETVKSIMSIGLSPFCMQVAASAIVVLINYQLNNYAPAAGITGDNAIAGFANANRLITLIVVIVIGLNQGMQPIIGFNYGAKNYIRVKETLVYAMKVATLITTVGCILGVGFPTFFVKAFSSSPEIIHISAIALRCVCLSFAILGFQMVVTSFFQCIGQARISIFLSLARQVIILIPALLIMPPIWGLDGVWLANPVSDVCAALLAGYMLYQQQKAFKKVRHVEHDKS